MNSQLTQMEREIQKANQLAETRRVERDDALQRMDLYRNQQSTFKIGDSEVESEKLRLLISENRELKRDKDNYR